MKKYLLSILIIISFIGFIGCKKYPDEPWRINTKEKFIQYYIQYTDHVIEIADS